MKNWVEFRNPFPSPDRLLHLFAHLYTALQFIYKYALFRGNATLCAIYVKLSNEEGVIKVGRCRLSATVFYFVDLQLLSICILCLVYAYNFLNGDNYDNASTPFNKSSLTAFVAPRHYDLEIFELPRRINKAAASSHILDFS